MYAPPMLPSVRVVFGQLAKKKKKKKKYIIIVNKHECPRFSEEFISYHIHIGVKENGQEQRLIAE